MRIDPIGDTDNMVSLLPFAWVGEQLMSVAIALSAGATVNFPEKPETIRQDVREIGPQLLLAPSATLGGDVLGVSGEDR